MPDDRYHGPRTDDLWTESDDSSGEFVVPSDPEPPRASDSWASDLLASTGDSSSDVWTPSTDSSDSRAPAGAPWVSDLWASTNEPSDDAWRAAGDTPAAEPSVDAPWVSDAWASTEPSPWVSDLWASTDPSTPVTTEDWGSNDPTVYSDLPPAPAGQPPADQPLVGEPRAADPAGSGTEPFWRSESWLLEPLPDESPSTARSVDAAPAPSWPDDPGAQPPDFGSDDPIRDRLVEAPTEPVSWSDLAEGSESTWTSYQRELDGTTDLLAEETHARPSARTSAVLDAPTASDFAAQRTASAPDPPTKGFPGFVYRASAGHVQLKPKKDERICRDATSDIRRSIAGLRQITFTNPKGGSGKTTAALLTSMTLGSLRGGYVLAWDNNETQGTLGVRARRDDHANTVRDLIADLPSFSGPVAGRVGDLAKFVRSQGDAMFDILASDEQAEAGEMMTAAAFQAVREVVGRFYKIICVDTGNNVRAANWAASIDSTDQLVVTASVRWESAYSASRMLDYLEQAGRADLVSNAVTVLTMPASMKGLNVSQVETHFGVRTREVLRVPFDAQLDNGDEIAFAKLTPATRMAWLQIAAAITRGL